MQSYHGLKEVGLLASNVAVWVVRVRNRRKHHIIHHNMQRHVMMYYYSII